MSAELELPDDADAKRETLRTLAVHRRQVLMEASAVAETRVNPAHPDCGPCAMAGAIADVLRIRAEDAM